MTSNRGGPDQFANAPPVVYLNYLFYKEKIKIPEIVTTLTQRLTPPCSRLELALS